MSQNLPAFDITLHHPENTCLRKCRASYIRRYPHTKPQDRSLYGCKSYVCTLTKWYEGKLLPVCAMKACRGNRVTDTFILNCCYRWKWVVSYTPWPLCLGIELRYPFIRMLVGLQNWRGTFYQKNFFPLSDFEPRMIYTAA